MLRLSLFFIGFLFIFASCNFNFTASGSIRIDTTKDSLDIVYKNVQVIVNDMNHDEIKERISSQFPSFSKETIKDSGMKYTKMWSADKNDTDANVYIKVTLNCSPSQSDEAMEVIKLYESHIIDELKKHSISVIK